MPSTVPARTPAQAARLEQRIKEHRAEVERLREETGDPDAALSAFVRERFERQALVPDDAPARDVSGFPWEDDDDSDAW